MASFGQITTYNILENQLINMQPTDPFGDWCFNDDLEQINAGIFWGMSWNSTNSQPVNSITVEMMYTTEEGNGPYDIALNGTLQTTHNPPLAACTYNVQSFTFTPTSYISGGVNQIMLDYTPGGDTHFMQPNGAWGGLFFARVIVSYECPFPVTSTDTQSTCDSLTWTNGITYTSSNNTATDTFTSVLGCDSIVTLNLTINSNAGLDVQSACDSFTWTDGNTYTSGNNSATDTLMNVVGCDSVVTLNLGITYSSTVTDVISACDSYMWIDGNTYTASNSTATDTLTNAAGCDSVITLNLTIDTVDVGVAFAFPFLSANAIGAIYQWIYCDSIAITGETFQNFVPGVSGNYAVIVTQNGCTDTSICGQVDIIGVFENSFGHTIKVYPNPTNGVLNIALGVVYSGITVAVSNVLGQVIEQQRFEAMEILRLRFEGESGFYLVEIRTEDGKLARITVLKN